MVILYVAIIGSTGYIGFALAKQYDRKKHFFRDLISFCNALTANLNYMRLNLDEMLRAGQNNYGKDFNCYINDRAAASALLSPEENADVASFFDCLGKNDAASQKQHVAFFAEAFKKRLEAAEVMCKERGVMYKKLSVLLGVLICILIM